MIILNVLECIFGNGPLIGCIHIDTADFIALIRIYLHRKATSLAYFCVT